MNENKADVVGIISMVLAVLNVVVLFLSVGWVACLLSERSETASMSAVR